MQDLPDPECVRLALAGDTQAFELLVTRYEKRVYAFSLRRMGNRSDAEDVALVTFDKVYRNLHRYRDRYAFSTWLFTILRREAASAWRKRTEHDPLDEEPVSHHRPDAQLETEDTLREVWTLARTTLSPNQFDAIWLKYGEHLSTSDVARELNKSPTTTKVLLHRARARLVNALTDHGILPSTLSVPPQPGSVPYAI